MKRNAKNRTVLCGTALFALAVLSCAAKAADLPPWTASGPPALLPGIPFSWTGFYFGPNVGYGWSTSSPSASGPGILGSGSENTSGVNAGVQLGFNWQINSWVFCYESDVQASDQNGSASYAGIAEHDKLPWFGTTRIRAGYAFDRILLYGTGGASYGQVTGTLTGALNTSISQITVGWTAGAGTEVAFAHNWSAKIEYLYVDLGNIDTAVGKVLVNSNFSSNMIRIGVNYNWGGL
jgi:outer membrane immunogenic protein